MMFIALIYFSYMEVQANQKDFLSNQVFDCHIPET